MQDVEQKSFLKVDEEGAEAASVTTVLLGAVSETPLADLRADRPFLFVIREWLSGTILFLGAVVEPPEARTDARGLATTHSAPSRPPHTTISAAREPPLQPK